MENRLLLRILADNKQALAQLKQLDGGLESMRGALARVGHYGVLAFSGWQVLSVARDTARLAESMTALQARLRIATDSARGFAEAQRGVLEISQRLGTNFESTGQLFVRTFSAIKAGGGTVSEALQTVNTVASALKLGGASAQESASAMLQFSQAMGAGVLRGEELNAVMEASTPLAQALADGLGVPIGRLKILGEQGALTSDLIRRALADQAEAIKEQAAILPGTIGQGFEAARTSAALYLAEADQAIGVTRTVGEAFRLAGRNIEVFGAALAAVVAASTVALVRLAAQAAATGTAIRALGVAMAFLGGPVGLLVGAVAGLGAYFITAGKKSEEGAASVERATQRIIDARSKLARAYKPGATEALEAQVAAEQERLADLERRAPRVSSLPAGGFASTSFQSRVALEKAALNRHNAEIAAQKKLIAELEKSAQVARSAPRTGVQLELAVREVDAFLAQFSSKTEKIEAKLAEFRRLAKTANLTEAQIAAGEAKIRTSANSAAGDRAAREEARRQRATAAREAARLAEEQARLLADLDDALLAHQLANLDIEKQAVEADYADKKLSAQAYYAEIARLETAAETQRLAALERARAEAERRAADPAQAGQAGLDLVKLDTQIAQARARIDLLARTLARDTATAAAQAASDAFAAAQKAIDAEFEKLRQAEANIEARQGAGLIDARAAGQELAAAYNNVNAAVAALLPNAEALATALAGEGRTDAAAYLEGIRTRLLGLKAPVDALGSSIAQTFESSFADAFASFVSGAKSASDAFRDLANSIISGLARIAAQEAAAGFLKSSGLGSAFNGLGSFIGGLFGVAHTGGVIGADALARRLVNPAVFLGAPRLHTGGLVGGEVPIIAKKGEGVFTPEQMAALAPAGSAPPVTVNVIESPGNGGQTRTRNEGGQSIVEVLVEQVKSRMIGDVRSRGDFSAALESQFGLNRAAGALR